MDVIDSKLAALWWVLKRRKGDLGERYLFEEYLMKLSVDRRKVAELMKSVYNDD